MHFPRRNGNTKWFIQWLAMALVAAVLVQGSQMSFSTLFCHVEGTAKVVAANDGCCATADDNTAHCLDSDRCCDVKISSKRIFAQIRALDSDFGTQWELLFPAESGNRALAERSAEWSNHRPIPDDPPRQGHENLQELYGQYRL